MSSLESRVGYSKKRQCVIFPFIIGAVSSALQQHFLSPRGPRRQNDYGTTIEGFCVGDGNQLLPPARHRGWRQHQKEASRVFNFTNDALCCYLLGWPRRIEKKAEFWIAMPLSSACRCAMLHGLTTAAPKVARRHVVSKWYHNSEKFTTNVARNDSVSSYTNSVYM